MTVISTATVAGPFTPNGATTEFPFAFKAASAAEIEVVSVLNGIETAISTALYSVDLDSEGGTVTFDTAPLLAIGDLYIRSIPDFTQESTFSGEGNFSAATLNPLFDRAALRDIYLKDGLDAILPEGARIPGAGASMFIAKDAEGNPVFSSGTGADAGLRTDLAAPGGTDLLLYAPPGATADLLTRMLDRLPLFIESFREEGDTDREVLTKAFAAWETQGGGELVGGGPTVTYDLGTEDIIGGANTTTVIFTVTGLRNATLDWAGSQITMTTGTKPVGLNTFNIPIVLQLTDFRNVEIRNVGRFADAGSVKTVAFQGAYFIAANGVDGPCQGLTLDNIRVEGALSAFVARGNVANRIDGIRITRSCHFKDVLYGSVFQDNGDNAILEYTCEDVVRVWIAYGVVNHHFDLYVRGEATPVGEGAFVFMRATRDSYGVTGKVTISGSLDQWQTTSGGVSAGYIFGFQQQNDDGAAAVLGGWDVDLIIEPGTQDTLGVHRLRFSSFTANAASENTGATSHTYGPIRIGGDLGGIAHPFHTRCTPDVPPVIALKNGIKGLGSTPTVGIPGFVLQVAPDRYVIEKFGDLTSGTIKFPMTALNNLVGMVVVTIAASVKSASTDGASSKAHFFRDVVGPYLASGTSAVLGGSPDAEHAVAFNSSNLTRAYSGNADGDLVITLGGSNYAVSTAYARVEIAAVLRPVSA